MVSRRTFTATIALAGWLPALTLGQANKTPPWPADRLATLNKALGKLEASSQGRLGVALLDSASGQLASYRGDERFLMLSSFKTLAAAYILARSDRGEDELTRRIPITEADLLEYAPVTRQHVGPQGMTLAELCEATITTSDNTAANLMHRSYGGPQALTQFVRSLGDSVTRHDRFEPELNERHATELLDTTSPNAMSRTLDTLLFGRALKPRSQQLLQSWLLANTTGDKRLRAGVPTEWAVGEKTGTASLVGANDVGFIHALGRPPIVAAVYLETTTIAISERDGAIAKIGEEIAALLATPLSD